MSNLAVRPELDFQSDAYKDAFSRINAIVVEGEGQAFDNFMAISQLIPDRKDELEDLAKMEGRHQKSFQACGNNLGVTPDLPFARDFFAELHENFQAAAAANQIARCLLIQGLIIESFAIAAYNIYIPVADPFARKITEGVVKDEYLHLNFGEEWLKANFDSVKAELEQANQENLPLIWKMLNQVEGDARTLGMEKEALVEDFMSSYGEALGNIGFTTREIMKMAAHGLSVA